jgi:hypothetical protein
MQTPTTAQIRTAIEVLERLDERITKNAARSLFQMPPCHGVGVVAGQIAVDAQEQTKQVKSLTGLLQTWHGELERKQKQGVSVHV